MNKRFAVALLITFAATSAHAQSRGHGGGSRGGHGGGGYAVPRGHASGGGGHGGGGAVARQPRPGGYYGGYGHGHGGYYGRGGYYGHGHGYYGHRYYGYYPYYRPYYGGYYPYYGYGYWPYAYGVGLGIGFYYGNGYGYASYSSPYAQVAYGGSYGRPAEAEEPADRGRSHIESTTDLGELRLQVGPEDAVIYVDGEFRGIASELVAVRLAPGRHRLEVVRPGYATAEREVQIGRGASASVRIELEPEAVRR